MELNEDSAVHGLTCIPNLISKYRMGQKKSSVLTTYKTKTTRKVRRIFGILTILINRIDIIESDPPDTVKPAGLLRQYRDPPISFREKHNTLNYASL